MGCSFCSKQKIISQNQISFDYLKKNPLRDINVESSNFSYEESNNNFPINYKDKMNNIKIINISPFKKEIYLEKNKEYDRKSYLINKLSAYIKGFLFRKKYEDYLKTQLMDHTNELYFQFIFLTRNFISSKILNNKENEQLNNILKITWKDFYSKDPTIQIKEQINKIKKYNNGFIFKYKNNNFDSNNIEQCLQNVKSCYKGSVELISNKKCGFGELININGTQEIGTFYNDEFYGWNIYVKNNGLLYIGLFNNDILNGHGLCFNPENGYLFKGILKDFQKEGFGVELSSEGNNYKGEFKEDKKNGKGEIIFKNKDIYKGEFSNDIINGIGQYIWNNNNKEYNGNFVNGKMDGNGLLKWDDNLYYKGLFINGIKEGKGEIGYLNKNKFYFDFKNDLPFGEGFFINNNNNKTPVIYYHGKIIDKNTNEIIFIFE